MSNALFTTLMSMLLAFAPAYWSFHLAGGKESAGKAKTYAAFGLAFCVWNFFVLVVMYLLEGWPISEAISKQIGMIFLAPIAWLIGNFIGKWSDKKSKNPDEKVDVISSKPEFVQEISTDNQLHELELEDVEYISDEGTAYIFPTRKAALEFSRKNDVTFRTRSILREDTEVSDNTSHAEVSGNTNHAEVARNTNDPEISGKTSHVSSDLSLEERLARLDGALKVARAGSQK